jgi:large repetitive protein
MTKTVTAFVLATALGLGISSAATAGSAAKRLPGTVNPLAYAVPGQLLVEFRRDTSVPAQRASIGALRARVFRRIGAGRRINVVHLAPGSSLDHALVRLRADPRVAVAEPNFVLRERIAPPPNDGSFGFQWGLENRGQQHLLGDSPSTNAGALWSGTPGADVDARRAWGVTRGSPATVIAIIDVGVDIGHPDLAANVWTNPGEIAGNHVDDDHNGKVDDVHGWDFVGNDNNPSPSAASGDTHGTFVAGVAAAQSGDGTAGKIAGMCPLCRIMPLRVHTLAQWIAALGYAEAKGADIVNMSIGGYFYSQLERNAIAAGRNSFLLVVAADNYSLDNDLPLAVDSDGNGKPDAFAPAYPGVYTLKNILHVAASNDADEYAYGTYCHFIQHLTKSRCAFTNFGHDSVDVAAPGVDIYGDLPTNAGTYGVEDGTSFSSPLTAGIAGLLKSQHPAYTPVQLRNAIMNSVDHPRTLQTLHAAIFRRAASGRFTRTNGRVNAFRALTGASTAGAFALTDGNIDGARRMRGAVVTGRVTWPADDNDVWARTLDKGRVYRVTMNGKDGQDFDLWAWKPGTKEIFEDFGCHSGCKLLAALTTNGRRNVETFKFRARSTDLYYFQVESWLRQGGRYSLSVRGA